MDDEIMLSCFSAVQYRHLNGIPTYFCTTGDTSKLHAYFLYLTMAHSIFGLHATNRSLETCFKNLFRSNNI